MTTPPLPSSIEILLPDIRLEDVHNKIPEMLHTIYLGDEGTNHVQDQLKCISFGPFSRIMTNLIVARKEDGVAKNVIFLVDSGCPYTFLSKEEDNTRFNYLTTILKM